MSNRNFFYGALVVLATIIYLSLYPFRWRIGLLPGDPLHELLLTAHRWPESHGDFIANTLLYLPWGFFATRSVPNHRSGFVRVLIATVLGAALSVSMESSQFYISRRYTDMWDVYANTLGALLGGIGGLMLMRMRLDVIRDVDFQPFPMALLAAFAAVRLYPFIPAIDLHKYLAAIRPLFDVAALSRGNLFLRSVIWLAVCYLVETVFGRRRALIAFVLLAGGIFLGRILIVDTELRLPSVVSAGLALLIWFAGLRFLPGRIAVLAIGFSLVVVIGRLSPFHLSHTSHGFEWMPFSSLLRGEIDIAVLAIVEKFFLYGGLIWLLMRAGLRLWRATAAVAILLLFCSFVDRYIPGRSAGITDALLAVLIGVLLRLSIGTRAGAPQPA